MRKRVRQRMVLRSVGKRGGGRQRPGQNPARKVREAECVGPRALEAREGSAMFLFYIR
ncbi:hypothetical protein D3C86_287800 [compost metagenome]